MQRSIEKTLFTAILALSSLALGVVPAVASSPSAGTSTGGFNDYEQEHVGPTPLPTCIKNTTDAVLTLQNTEIVVPGHLGSTTAMVTIDAHILHFNPAGTFSDPGCTIPGPVDATLRISGHCEGDDGVAAQYSRVGEIGLVITTEPCGGHIWEFEGTQHACLPGAPFDPCAITNEWDGIYEAIPV